MTIFETVRNEKMTSIQLNVNEKIFQNSSFPKNNFKINLEKDESQSNKQKGARVSRLGFIIVWNKNYLRWILCHITLLHKVFCSYFIKSSYKF